MTMLEAAEGDAGSSLADAVFARLKSDILLGVLAAGSRRSPQSRLARPK